MAHYIDTSALVKLVVAERETDALRAWIDAEHPTLVASDLARAELLRAVRRRAPDRVVHARRVLDSIVIMAITTSTYESAGLLEPTILCTLDAVHIASALTLGDDLDAIVAYDDRLADAAQSNGIPVLTPS